MNNLKIYNGIKNNFKYVLVPLALTSTIILSSCSSLNNKNLNSNDKSYYNIYQSEVENSYAPSQNSSMDSKTTANNSSMNKIADGIYIGKKIEFTEKNNQTFLLDLNKIDIDYKYDNLYNLSSAIDKYNLIEHADSHPNTDYLITKDNVYNIIKSNNDEYKKNNHLVLYKELSKKELEQLCELIVSTINDYIKSNPSIEEHRVKCIINNLKIFNQNSSIANAFVTDDDCLILGTNTMKIATVLMGKNADTDVITHEIVHLLQKGCRCDLNKNSNLIHNFGVSYKFNNIDINSLDFTWFYEASAEKEMVNYTGDKPITYQNMIGYLESLSLVNILNDNYKVNDTEKLSYKHSLDDLYNYFNVNSEADKKSVLNLMYSIQIMQMASDDFYNIYSKSTGEKKDNELIDEINYTLKSSVCLELSKLFYRNLSLNIIDKDVTLEDVFYLISLFENDLNNHILYKKQTLYNYNKDFIDKYVDIQDIFFSELAKSANISDNELFKLYGNYTVKLKESNGKEVENYCLNFLSNYKKDYLKERQEALKNIATVSIRDVQSMFNELNLHK